jgi:Tfp pilus assembly protein PilN
MLNLMPQQEKKRLVLDYRLRLACVTAIFVSVLAVIASIGLFPSYINERSKRTALEKEQQRAAAQDTDAAIQKLEAVSASNKLLADYIESRIALIQSVPLASSIAERIFAAAGASVTITAIDIIASTITVRGSADTRSELIAFHQRLKQDPDFKGAVLPIADIAKSVNPEFNIQISL